MLSPKSEPRRFTMKSRNNSLSRISTEGKKVTFSSKLACRNSSLITHQLSNRPQRRGAVSGDEGPSDNINTRHGGCRLRKRSHSFSDGYYKSSSSVIPNKRWRGACYKTGRGNRTSNITLNFKKNNVLPSKFLLGGNIHDPLNLNSLSDQRVSKLLNAATPESSPIPTPKHRKSGYKIEVLIPPNITDPLNLTEAVDEVEYESRFTSTKSNSVSCSDLSSINLNHQQRRSRLRHRKRRNESNIRTSVGINSDSDDSVNLCDAKEICVPSTNNLDNVSGDNKPKLNDAVPKLIEEIKESGLSPLKQTLNSKKLTIAVNRSLTPPPLPGISSILPSISVKKAQHFTSEIVSPVVPQPGEKCMSIQHGPRHNPVSERIKSEPLFKDKNKRFQYGNYDRYYAYRIPDHGEDPRFQFFRAEWFTGKDVLDIGCNVGQITIMLAKNYSPKSIVGLDIDRFLIDKARKSLRNYSSCLSNGKLVYPRSFPHQYGPIVIPYDLKRENELADDDDLSTGQQRKGGAKNPVFPSNVQFVCGNYVVENDELLNSVIPEYDVIVCLSTTKWMHLNFGDQGIKRAFRRMHAQLRPGGRLILESQPFSSYRKKKRLTERIFRNFQAIQLWPENFAEYILHQVGFATAEVIGCPQNLASSGFQRPIQMFTKMAARSADFCSSRSGSSCATTPYVMNSPFGNIPTPNLTATPNYARSALLYAPSLFESSSQNFDACFGRGAGLFVGDADTSAYSPLYSPFTRSHRPTYGGPSGITPGYSGPSPDGLMAEPSVSLDKSPVYTGPQPGTFSGASTPGSSYFVEPTTPSYTPSYSSYTPTHNPSSVVYSPGNATPRYSGSTPGSTPVFGYSPGSASPRIQMGDITGNTTPHTSMSQSPNDNPPTYYWYGQQSGSGSNTPQSTPRAEPSSSPARIMATKYSSLVSPQTADSSPRSPANNNTHPSSPTDPGISPDYGNSST